MSNPRNNPQRVAVILFNLGGPDGQKTVAPFLYRFFTDRNIIPLPFPLRHAIATLIAFRRSRKEAGVSYGYLDWRSPLLPNTKAQAQALEDTLNADTGTTFKCFPCMRYWHPLADVVAAEVKDWGADRIVLLPLYPQFSTTTTRSSFQSWDKAIAKAGLDRPTTPICCYPLNAGFIEASARNIRPLYDQCIAAIGRKPRLLFSAHGLPERIIEGGDPYQWQCERTAQAIAEALEIPDLDWTICYQSRVGRLPWIGPSTTDGLENAARDGVPVLLYPHAFVSEHVETLVELDIEYRHLADELKLPWYGRAQTVSAHNAFIGGLKRAVLDNMDRTHIAPDSGTRICPANFTQCPCAA